MTRSATVLSLLLLLPLASRGDGLIYQLPPDGSWVKLAGTGRHWGHERIVPPDTVAKDDSEATMPKEEFVRGAFVLQSVGTVDLDGEKCRWIELRTEAPADAEDRPEPEVWKMLIPENRMKTGSDPLSHVRKMYIKAGFVTDGLERVDTDKKLLAYEIERIRKWFPAVPAEYRREANYLVRVDGRDIRGESLRFDSYFEGKLHRGTAGFYSNRCRHHTVLDAAIPFGVGLYSVEGESVERYEDGSGWKSKFREEFWVVDFGAGATTALPDHQ